MNAGEFANMKANAVQVASELHVWRWEIPVYLFLGGLVAGLMVVGALLMLRGKSSWHNRVGPWIPLVAAAALSAGMLFLLLDLSFKTHVWRFYLAFRPSSPMSWGAWVLIATYPALGLWLLGSMPDRFWQSVTSRLSFVALLNGLRGWASAQMKTILLANVVMGVVLGTYTGILLQTLIARPLWNTGLLGLLFLTSGISAGAALLMFSRPDPKVFRELLLWDMGALVFEAFLLALFLLTKGAGHAVDKASAMLLLSGPYTGAFFALVVLGGIAVPLIMEWAEFKHRAVRVALLAPVLVLIGGLALRAILVAAGQTSSFN